MPVRGSILTKFIKDALQEQSYPNTLYWYEENEIFFLHCFHAKNKAGLAEQNSIYEAWDKIKPRKSNVENPSKKQRFNQALKKAEKYLVEVKRLSTKNKKAYKFQDPNINSPEQIQNDHSGTEEDSMLQSSEEVHINNHDETHVYAANGLSVEMELLPQIPSGQSDACNSLSEQYDGIHASSSHFQSAGTITYDSVSVAASYKVRETGNTIEFISEEDLGTPSDKRLVILHCNKSSNPQNFANLNR